MSENDIQSQRKALESLVVGNADLERLETLLDQFNIFEAVGMTRQETRHSHFLAFLLDPQQKHGLGDAFLKRFLQEVVASVDGISPVSPIDLDVWNLNGTVVRREWRNIDILLEDAANKLLVVIENKVDSGEHDDQLARYWEIAHKHFAGWKIIGIFLTIDGQQALDERDKYYLPISYSVISELVKELAERRATTLGTEVRTLMQHYAQMLERHIVNESEIAGLCQQIYQKHKQALDLIFEQRSDHQSAIRDVLLTLTKKPTYELDRVGKTVVTFLPNEWEGIPALQQGSGWTKSGRLLMFEFSNNEKSLKLTLYIGPGPLETREKLLRVAQNGTPFRAAPTLRAKWNSIYSREFLTARDYEELSAEEREEKILKQWEAFTRDDLPKIKAAVQAANL